MRQTMESSNHSGQREGMGFVIGAIVCAAVVASLFTLHGGPDLVTASLPALAPASIQSP